MKKNIFYIIFASLFYFICRMIPLSGILGGNASFSAFFVSFFFIVLPSLYGAVSYFLVGRLPKVLLMNGAALIAAAIVITLYTKCPPLSEGVWIVLQLPVLVLSSLAAKLVHAMPARIYQYLLALLFFIILAVVSGVVYLVSLVIVGW